MNRVYLIDKSELAKIPFIDSQNIRGRVLTTLTFYEDEEWHMWLPLPTGLLKIKGNPAEADYFARQPEKKTDMYFDFINFMTQRACWSNVMRSIDGIRNGVHNLGASLGKLALFYQCSQEKKIVVTRYASTEIEYIFGVCRSMFDLLQDVIANLWDRIELVDKNMKKCQLPRSFRSMVLKDEKLMDESTIVARFKVPKELAAFYYRNGSFFKMLRAYRDGIIHNGVVFKTIFVTERGFAVSANTEPFVSFKVWNEEHMLPNRLASLRPAIAYVITETLRVCEDFSQTIQRIIKFPPAIAPGFKLFIRGFHNHELLAMKDVLEKCLWWEGKHIAQ